MKKQKMRKKAKTNLKKKLKNFQKTLDKIKSLIYNILETADSGYII